MSTEPRREPIVAPSHRKLKALAKLQGLAAKLSDATDYNLEQYVLVDVTLDQVRQGLSDIRGSLADAVTDERAR